MLWTRGDVRCGGQSVMCDEVGITWSVNGWAEVMGWTEDEG